MGDRGGEDEAGAGEGTVSSEVDNMKSVYGTIVLSVSGIVGAWGSFKVKDYGARCERQFSLIPRPLTPQGEGGPAILNKRCFSLVMPRNTLSSRLHGNSHVALFSKGGAVAQPGGPSRATLSI